MRDKHAEAERDASVKSQLALAELDYMLGEFDAIMSRGTAKNHPDVIRASQWLRRRCKTIRIILDVESK